ncbi:MAG: hypothetical protein GXP58_01850, partial [Deltaproteobacteria bacterium]|nr:hypothetical protein [Deltaproteobacteria bacterium]
MESLETIKTTKPMRDLMRHTAVKNIKMKCMLFVFLALWLVTFQEASATYITTDISSAANAQLISDYLSKPPSPLGGVPFDIPTTGNDVFSFSDIWITTNGNSLTLSTNAPDATTAYLLVNSNWGVSNFAAGSVTFTTQGGQSYTINLVGGVNIRDWNNGTFVNTVSDPNSTPVFEVTSGKYNLPGRIDMLKVALPASFIGDTVTSITVTDNGSDNYSHIRLAGVTMETEPKAYSSYSTVDLRGLFNEQLSNYYLSSPVSPLGGIPFDIPASGSDFFCFSDSWINTNGNTISITTSANNVQKVYLLLNTFWGRTPFRAGSITFRTLRGQLYTVDLITGFNIRDWNQAGNANAVTDSNSVPVFVTQHDVNGVEGRLDMLGVDLPHSFWNDSITSIEIVDHGSDSVSHLMLAGITFEKHIPDINFLDFSDTTDLSLAGSATQYNNKIRLTNTGYQAGAFWYQNKQLVQKGFDTTFDFQITPTNSGADGFAFVIQNDSAAALGGNGGGLGYKNIPASLAVEFDTFLNSSWDSDDNHICVQSMGVAPNSQDQSAALGCASNIPNLSDGNIHSVKISYNRGNIDIYIDDLSTPVLSVSLDLETLLNLQSDLAWVGFTGGTGGQWENHDILNWTFQVDSSDLLADSVREFSGVQGQDNLEYGYYNKTGDSDGIFQQGDFTLFPDDDGPGVNSTDFWNNLEEFWGWYVKPPYVELYSEVFHPNSVQSGNELWAMKRWISDYEGDVTIYGVLAKNPLATAGGDGTVGYIFVNGVEKFSFPVAYNDSTGINYLIKFPVTVGATVDFAIAPNATENYDSTNFTAKIFSNTAITDSVSGFSGVQGQDNWEYGYYNKTVDSDGIYQPGDFTLFPDDDGPGTSPNDYWNGIVWNWYNGNPPWTSLFAGGGHPNGINNGQEHWAIRRWLSNVNGNINIFGHIAKRADAIVGGDGIIGSIIVNGSVVWTQSVSYNDSVGFNYAITVPVNLGDPVDFVIAPKADDSYDATNFTATISASTTLSTYNITITDDKASNVLTVAATFNEDMDTGVSPVVTFGTAAPYDIYVLSGVWLDARTWEGTYSGTVADDTYTLSFSQATDWAGNVMAPDTSHTFIVDRVTTLLNDSLEGSSLGVITGGLFDYGYQGQGLSLTGTDRVDYDPAVIHAAAGTLEFHFLWYETDGRILSIIDGAGTPVTLDIQSGTLMLDINGTQILSSTVLVPGAWYQVAVTYGAGGSFLYVNGVSEADSITPVDLTGATGLVFGAEGINASCDMIVDNIRSSSREPDLRLAVPTDFQAPFITFTQLSPASPVKAETVTYTLDFSEPMDPSILPAVSVIDPNAVPYTITDGAWLDTDTWQGTYTFTPAMQNGTYHLSVSGARGLDHNSMLLANSYSFELDTVPPADPTVDVPVPALTGTTMLPLSGTKEAYSDIRINGAQMVPPSVNTAWSVSYRLNEGAQSLIITSRDAAGNASGALTYNVTLDTIPPSLTINPVTSPTDVNTQTISGTTEAAAALTVNVATSITVNPDGAWSYDTPAMSDGPNQFTFTAVDTAGNSVTRSVTIDYDGSAPQPIPLNLFQVDENGDGSTVHLSWAGYTETDVAFYQIYKELSSFNTVSGLNTVQTVNAGTQTASVGGLTKGQTYYFAVVPFDDMGHFDPAVTSKPGTPMDTQAPAEVTALSVLSVTEDGSRVNTVTLGWTGNTTEPDVAGQTLYFNDGTGYDSGTPVPLGDNTYTKPGLSDETQYTFRITLTDQDGNESNGAVIQPVTLLRNPANLAVTPASGQVTLTWDDLPSSLLGYVDHYNVYYDVNPISDVTGLTPAATVSVSGMGGQAVITGLTNGQQYDFAVTTVNISGGERKTVIPVSAAPRSDTTPPEISSINITDGQVIDQPYNINVTVADTESAVASVAIGVDGTNLATSATNTAAAFYNIGLPYLIYADGNHTVEITTFDAAGNQAVYSYGIVVSGAQPDPPVLTGTVPSGTVSTPTLTSVDGTAEEAQIITLLVNGVLWDSIAVVKSSKQFSFPDVIISEGSNELKAIATDRRGDSAPSMPFYVTLDTGAPGAPLSLTAGAQAGGVIHFQWSPPTGEVPDHYVLYQSAAGFTSPSDPGVTAVSSAITVADTDYLPADDDLYYYAVTSVDGTGNESPISNVVSLAGDRLPPAATISVDPDRLISGNVTITVNAAEDLAELPFVSVIPAGSTPIPIAMKAAGSNTWTGTFTVDGQTPHGPAAITYSGKDYVGNRSTVATGETTVFVDHQGPRATISLSSAAPFSVKTNVNVGVTVQFDEIVSGTPLLDLNTPDGTVSSIALTRQIDGSWTGAQTFTLSMLGGLENGQCLFILSATDLVGNTDTVITEGETFVIYNKQLPPLDAPVLTAVALAGGQVDLNWTQVNGAVGGYDIYRRTAAQLPSEAVLVIGGVNSTTYKDVPPYEDTYYYSVEGIDLEGDPGLSSVEVPVTLDSTPPAAPATLTLTEQGSGIKAAWDASVDADVVAYRLYQDATGTIVPGVSRLIGETASLTLIDNMPAAGPNTYGVTAVDAVGNESAPTTAQIGVTLPPVSQLTVTHTSLGEVRLDWAVSTGMSYFVYRNGVKVTTTPLAGGPYLDNYYTGGSVIYGVSVTDGTNESPVREVTLPDVSVSLASGQVLRRGSLSRLNVSILNHESQDWTFNELEVTVGTDGVTNHIPLSSPVPAGSQLTVAKVVAVPDSAASQETVDLALVGRPEPGSTVRLETVSTVGLTDADVTVEILNDPLLRGGQASVQLKVSNNGDIPIQIVTAEQDGAKPSPDIRVDLVDVDGNILATGALKQSLGGPEFILKSNHVIVAAIQPGKSLTLAPIQFVVPSASPNLVKLSANIANIYYDYNGSNQVQAPGPAREQEVFLSDTSYSVSAQVAGNKTLFKTDPVLITGLAVSNTTGQPMPYVPVKVGVSVQGFVRYLTATTDASGNYQVMFVPRPNEAGVYTVWGAHPDIYDHYVQDTFTISSFVISPSIETWQMSKNGSIVVPIKLSNPGETDLNNLTYTVVGSDPEIT